MIAHEHIAVNLSIKRIIARSNFFNFTKYQVKSLRSVDMFSTFQVLKLLNSSSHIPILFIQLL